MYTIASLSEQSWVSDPRTILSYVVTSYMLTDAAQTLVFTNNLKSLPYTYHLHINNPEAMALAISDELTQLLNVYFQYSEVTTTSELLSGSAYSITIRATAVTELGEKYDLAKTMEIDGNNLRNVINLNNLGVASL